MTSDGEASVQNLVSCVFLLISCFYRVAFWCDRFSETVHEAKNKAVHISCFPGGPRLKQYVPLVCPTMDDAVPPSPCRFDRLEVLAVFASTVLIQLGALFILKERCVSMHKQTSTHASKETLVDKT